MFCTGCSTIEPNHAVSLAYLLPARHPMTVSGSVVLRAQKHVLLNPRHDTMAGLQVDAGEVLHVGTAVQGARCYIAVAGGFDAPIYLGSRSTFPSGNLGGYQGRPLAVGDSCELGVPPDDGAKEGTVVPEAFRPALGEEEEGVKLWKVTMLQGPQTAPDYFTEDDMKV
jgi:allophanate hydrolase subunit 2